jgi:alginate O-acetyltransferase complex protein AlgI
MAIGLGRCFGVKLPPNFDSPLKASSIIDFWLRWHMTLTRFLTAYLYNPMVLALTRRRFARGHREGGSRNFTAGGFLELLAGPTILTMLVSGLWHGAGYLFLLWGLLHGVYLTINHAWRQIGPRLWKTKESYARFMKPVGLVLTFLSVAFAMVLFRAPTLAAASDLLRGMLGRNGLTVPQQIFDRLGPLVGFLHPVLPISAGGALLDTTIALAWIAALLVIALAMPNSLDLLSDYEPALGIKPRPGSRVLARLLHWSPQLPWAFATSALAVTAIMMLGRKTEFLYWQF